MAPKGPYKWSKELEDAAIEAFGECPEYGIAASAAGVSRNTLTHYYHTKPDFKARMDEARSKFVKSLIKEALRRGRDGYAELKQGKDGTFYDVTKYSDSLLTTLLKKYEPMFNEKVKVEQTVTGKVEHEHKHKIDPQKLDKESRDLVEQLLLRNRTPCPESPSNN